MTDQWMLDAVLVPFGVLALVAYNVTFYYRVKFRPLNTVVGVNHINRRAWVRCVMKDIDKKNILAVQTLRNSIMASTLLASTAILLATAMATFVASAVTALVQNSVSSMILGSHAPALIAAKYFSILLCFVFSFMCHVQSIRYTNHVNFLISIPESPELPGLTPEYVANVLARGSDFYTIGTRGFYCAMPLLLWLFGPIPMVVSSLILVVALYNLDTASGFDISNTTVHADHSASNDGHRTSYRSSKDAQEDAEQGHGQKPVYSSNNETGASSQQRAGWQALEAE